MSSNTTVGAQSPAIAIISGRGDLPRLIAESSKAQGEDYHLVTFKNITEDWANDHPQIPAEFEKPGRLFKALKAAGCTRIIFAGGMDRPSLNPLKYDWKFLTLAPRLLPALKGGDDALLSLLMSVFEKEGFEIVAAHDYLGGLVLDPGALTSKEPDEKDHSDIKRAVEIIDALGRVDVGQASVVAQGLCLGVESIQGTDALLDFVAGSAEKYRVLENGGQGVLVKMPKPDQDWRVDLPAIGVETVKRAAQAGLSGIALQAGAVLVLGKEAVLKEAEQHNIFIYAFEAS